MADQQQQQSQPQKPQPSSACSAFQHAKDFSTQVYWYLDTKANSWKRCQQAPCPNAANSSISVNRSLPNGTIFIPVSGPNPPIGGSGTVSWAPVIETLAKTQSDLQKQIQTLTEQLSHTANRPAKSSIKEPEPFKGDRADARRFISMFGSWAADQAGLRDENGVHDGRKWIQSALSFMRGEAGQWATPFAVQFNEYNPDNLAARLPWDGDWETFLKAYNVWWLAVDDKAEARTQLQSLSQGKLSVAEFAARFQELGDCSGF